MQPDGLGMSSTDCPFKNASRHGAYMRSTTSLLFGGEVDAVLQLFAAGEERHPLLRHLHLCPRARVATLAGATRLGDEAAEAADLDAVVAGGGGGRAVGK